MRASGRSGVTRAVILVGVLVVTGLVPASGAAAAKKSPEGVVAEFEGSEINLADGWGDATACLVWQQGGVVECFRTEAELDARVAELGIESTASSDGGGFVMSSVTCSSYLRLYNGTSYTGSVLYLADRYQWLNLANFGFDQKTSSYKIGACSAYFADWANGGGDWYPISLTEAYDQFAAMLSGWNNDVSSVYIT